MIARFIQGTFCKKFPRPLKNFCPFFYFAFPPPRPTAAAGEGESGRLEIFTILPIWWSLVYTILLIFYLCGGVLIQHYFTNCKSDYSGAYK